VTVTAKARVPATIASTFAKNIDVSASATARRGNPVRQVEFKVENFNSNAWDANQIYWYVVPKDGTPPKDEDLHLLLSNDPNNPGPDLPAQIQIGMDDEIGFAMINVTGGVRSYGQNSYGQAQGSVHKFYSHKEPENLRFGGVADCTNGRSRHSWDDNGGGTDDNDYNDAVYEYTCTTLVTDPKTVYLIR
jgi:hypothetical protein